MRSGERTRWACFPGVGVTPLLIIAIDPLLIVTEEVCSLWRRHSGSDSHERIVDPLGSGQINVLRSSLGCQGKQDKEIDNVYLLYLLNDLGNICPWKINAFSIIFLDFFWQITENLIRNMIRSQQQVVVCLKFGFSRSVDATLHHNLKFILQSKNRR